MPSAAATNLRIRFTMLTPPGERGKVTRSDRPVMPRLRGASAGGVRRADGADRERHRRMAGSGDGQVPGARIATLERVPEDRGSHAEAGLDVAERSLSL